MYLPSVYFTLVNFTSYFLLVISIKSILEAYATDTDTFLFLVFFSVFIGLLLFVLLVLFEYISFF